MRREQNYSLKQHNTFGIEAKCAQFVEYSTEAEAKEVAELLRTTRVPYIIIGGGSNLLLTRDYEGIVVHSTCKGIERNGNRLVCGSGEVFDDVVAQSIEMGLYGAENLSLIPGDVGASAVQNIGAYGAEAKDLIRSIRAVEIATGNVCVIENAECEYGYRQSKFKHDWKNQYLILSVEYEFAATFEPRLDYGNIRAELEKEGISLPTAQQLRDTIIRIREAKLPDPKVLGNAGSFFMNPIVDRQKYEALAAQYEVMPHYDIDAEHVKIPAGWMIDQCGWKGKSMGRAGVHDKQALVLVNRGGATGQEVVALCQQIQADVKQKFGIDIYPEVNVI
ncbi:UDP-N-acetylmuramate dehydrogenase [Xylanibacter ruminicola]|uniref:UDP-N-acetylmuramate dehydrogenase n=1 Tax=Xylanibacter ruminicola TaxID=839 RepID=UPI00048E604D|nr:UDP-N-acetylmuramate dehydrogenase [Xylanibacter ruminicola]